MAMREARTALESPAGSITLLHDEEPRSDSASPRGPCGFTRRRRLQRPARRNWRAEQSHWQKPRSLIDAAQSCRGYLDWRRMDNVTLGTYAAGMLSGEAFR
jgi:hypothetical protein